MEPSDDPYKMYKRPEQDSVSAEAQRVAEEAKEAWDKWLAGLKQGDPGQRTREEVKKAGDWIDHMGERISNTVQGWVDIVGPRR